MRELESRLLSGRNRLSVSEKEEVLSGVLAETAVAPGAGRPALRRIAVASGLLAATAAFFFFLGRRGEQEPFAARGGEAPTFRALCASSGEAGRCSSGDRLLFEVAGTRGAAHFAAFAQRPDGAVVWYLPAAGESSASVAARAEAGLLDTAVILGADHPPGSYRLHGVFSAQPMSRAEIREAVTERDPDVLVVERTLEVER